MCGHLPTTRARSLLLWTGGGTWHVVQCNCVSTEKALIERLQQRKLGYGGHLAAPGEKHWI